MFDKVFESLRSGNSRFTYEYVNIDYDQEPSHEGESLCWDIVAKGNHKSGRFAGIPVRRGYFGGVGEIFSNRISLNRIFITS